MDSVISLRLAVYGLALTCLCGCASTGNIVAPPAVELTSVALSDANIHRQTFLLGFRVENPNPFPLPVRAVEYTLLFDDEKFASGESIGSISVPAGGKTAFSISVELDFMRSASHMSSLLSGAMTEVVSYELNGNLVVDMPLVQPIPYSNTGVINLSARLP